MKTYLDALEFILKNGTLKHNRTGIDTISYFVYNMRFDLSKGFPAVTTKKLPWKAVVGELLWFLEGSTDERRLAEITFEQDRRNLKGKQTIWTANADKQGKDLGYINTDFCKELGPVYGSQWRKFGKTSSASTTGIDQITTIIDQLKNDQESRRIILSAWNPGQIEEMALPPCHIMAIFNITNNKLSCHMTQRSADMFLGVPFNIASYALLTSILAQICGLEVGEFVISLTDAHIYVNHIEQVKEQISRTPGKSPTLEMPGFYSLWELLLTKPSEYNLLNYSPQEVIKAPMAV
ncbi:MAG: thymidylate synthase [Bacteroidetes bacterium]|nr:thymidylate synthase [Bacteroidota bacterium]